MFYLDEDHFQLFVLWIYLQLNSFKREKHFVQADETEASNQLICVLDDRVIVIKQSEYCIVYSGTQQEDNLKTEYELDFFAYSAMELNHGPQKNDAVDQQKQAGQRLHHYQIKLHTS